MSVSGTAEMSQARPSIVFMFSGQGSQHFQMGQELFETDATFREWMLRLDEVAKKSIDQSIVQTLYAPDRRKSDPFDRTLLTHPAIFMVEYALARSLMHEGLQPDCVLGVSLGSFAAAAVAGFIDAEEAMRLVLHQALAIDRHAGAGGMIAVMAPSALYREDMELSGASELAAVNFSSHFTLAAPACNVARIEAVLMRRGIAFQRLPVSAAFHSRWIDAARTPFAQHIEISARHAQLPLACCECADILQELPSDYFWRVIRKPIRFAETIAGLERSPRCYMDVGPAGTLATFLKYLLPHGSRSSAHSILTMYGGGRENMVKSIAAVKSRLHDKPVLLA